MPRAVKQDRKVSRRVADENGAPETAGRYNKKLLSGAARLDDLRTLAGQVRRSFYKITLPWSDEGYRLLPANFYFDWTQKMREFEAILERKVADFLALYPSYIEQVRPELNGLFREEDYPSVEKLRTKFGVKIEVLPTPSGEDFRVTMLAEEQARVAREIDTNVRESLSRGTADLWNRLQDLVSHTVDRLNEPESRFHASLQSSRATRHWSYEMDAVLREREEKQETTQEVGSASSADHIFSHRFAYMEAASQ